MTAFARNGTGLAASTFVIATVGLAAASARAQDAMMDIKTFVAECRAKQPTCKAALEMVVFGIANGAQNAAKLAGRPDAADRYVKNPCNELVGRWKGNELVDRFNSFASSWDLDKTGPAPYAMIVGAFAIGTACIP